MGNQHQQVDQCLIPVALDFVVFEEDVDPEHSESLVDDVVSLDLVEARVAGSIQLGLEGNQSQPAGSFAIKLVELGVQSLHHYASTIRSI